MSTTPEVSRSTPEEVIRVLGEMYVPNLFQPQYQRALDALLERHAAESTVEVVDETPSEGVFDLAKWRDAADAAIASLANSQTALTADDVWDYLEGEGVAAPADGRLLSARLFNAKRHGLISNSGKQEISNRRGVPHSVAVWSSNVFEG